MFSSAFKSISATNITGNYSISSAPTSTAGPWKIFDAKKKSTGKPYSVFVFDRKSLDSHGSSLGRSGAASFKKTVEEVVERLKKEASSLAKLRHPNILELVEPVEETRGGGLQFVTESVTASLSSLLQEKDEQERAGGPGGRSSRYVTEDADGTKRRRELEIDELEIQKGLLQVSKALEFLHENAGIVHGNLTPDASDWKISGLAFASPPEGSDKPTSIQGINLYEVLNMDPRLPKAVQLNLDYSSPDFVVDNNLNSSADMFSLGLIRPAQRMTAREFQQSEYFDNILVSTIRFLDSFPAKTANEKASFMRGLNKVLPSFPKSVMEKKILPALIEELKDRDLLSLILQNVFKILDLLPSAKRAFSEKVRPALREIFVVNAKQTQEKDPARDAGLMVVLEHISSISSNCSGKEFKDDMLPVIMAAIECPTHSIVDAALRSLPVVLPVLDFSTIKNELFPVIAAVFSKTNSLAIKVRGLRAFVILCGGTNDNGEDDGLNGLENKKTSSSSALDKYTMQEKIVPLIRVIKTKEPAVMMAALNVLRVVGSVADAEFVAMEILPILWSMSLGPLLNLKQFQGFMELIKSLSRRVEDEQTRKLQELGGPSNGAAAPSEDFMAFGGVTGTTFDQNNGATEDDFENLVKGRMSSPRSSTATPSWDDPAKSKSSTPAPTFSWSTPPPPTNNPALKPPAQKAPSFRTVTPDLGRFEALTPSSTQFSQPLQPTQSQPFQPPTQLQQQPLAPPQPLTASTSGSSINWSAAAKATPSPWGSSSGFGTSASTGNMGSSMASMSLNSTSRQPSFTLPPPPGNTSTTPSSFTMPPPPTNWSGMTSMSNATQNTTQSNTGQKSGLDKYESLI
ncbi:Protein kinase domain-containing protein ppk32 [Fusarium oxysporum f. sp. cubense race 1]|uniref:Protein kinase domain-containing protein ppk32 n=1 Tax=Fusarium oxysporum f. sp. cubense (strain race 1) TaxID=1229664 RepID=N4UUX3_FUSC1|nr:Protein kinase domain-containing protein ppk32 [Fusarium oxysporum f. sp. cubense race 1]